MAKFPPTTSKRTTSPSHIPSNDSPATAAATAALGTLPPPTAHALPLPSQLMLPPPTSHPNPASPPPPLSSTIVHTVAVCSTTEVTSSSSSSSPPAKSPSATVSAPLPSPRSLKLQSQISTLQSQIATTQASLNDTLAKFQAQLCSTAANSPPILHAPQNEPDAQAQAEAIVKRHIKLLHTYNEIKDVGQGLMGLIADSRGVRLTEVMEEMGVGEKD